MENSNMNIWRDNVVACAFAYANHKWVPSGHNLLHGEDADGILVNTPDEGYKSAKYNCGWWRLNVSNQGIPYHWGGASSIDDFDRGIASGMFAGNVPDYRDSRVSKYCTGVDCSGLVTVCWGETNKLSTGII